MNKDVDSKITFISDCSDSEKSWIMELSREGIRFNKKGYPYAKTDEFAKAVIEILENEYAVKFERKEPPYDRKIKQEPSHETKDDL